MASGERSDRDVVDGEEAGNDRMYRKLVTRYIRRALAVAWEPTDTLSDAEDLVQPVDVAAAAP
jgi:DNA-directed RNA polymerase specialized sigma24 family protein